MILKNGGEGAPLNTNISSIISFSKKKNLRFVFLNIGGISNVTIIQHKNDNSLFSKDIGPGNCLIDGMD